MEQLLSIPVSDGDTIICKVILPDSAPVGYILNCRGIGRSGLDVKGRERRWIYTVAGMEKNLVGQGFAMACVSPRSYNEDASLSIDKFVNDLALVAEQLSENYGTALFAMGHSFGAYVIARLELTNQHHPFEAIALLNPPLSIGESVNSLATAYSKRPSGMREIVAKAVLAAFGVRHDGSAAALLDEILTEPSLDDKMVSGNRSNGNSAIRTPTMIVYGKRDPYLFKDAGLMLGLQQDWEVYEARWQQIAPNSRMEGRPGVGHHFGTGARQMLWSAVLRRTSPEANRIACEIGSYFKSALENTRAVN